MIPWHEMSPDLRTPPGPKNKPILVTRYRSHWSLGGRIGPIYGAFFRRYWTANIVSFIWHHFFGYNCNTWKRNDQTT